MRRRDTSLLGGDISDGAELEGDVLGGFIFYRAYKVREATLERLTGRNCVIDRTCGYF